MNVQDNEKQTMMYWYRNGNGRDAKGPEPSARIAGLDYIAQSREDGWLV